MAFFVSVGGFFIQQPGTLADAQAFHDDARRAELEAPVKKTFKLSRRPLVERESGTR